MPRFTLMSSHTAAKHVAAGVCRAREASPAARTVLLHLLALSMHTMLHTHEGGMW